MTKFANVEFRLRRRTAAAWTLTDPVLGPSEPGHEKDTNRFKLGDGVSKWSELEYFLPEGQLLEMINEAIANSGGGGADTRIGNMADLNTVHKESVVGALNEVNSVSIPLSTRYTNAKAG